MSSPSDLLKRHATDLVRELADDLVSLSVHGSWVLGDFVPNRSDLDMLAALATEPSASTLRTLEVIHTQLDEDFPEWKGHIEVDYVAVQTIAAVLRGTAEAHQMIRISPGEPLHQLEASRHYVLNWAAALQANTSLVGPPPSAVLPLIDRRLVQEVVLDHVRAWPIWVQEGRYSVGSQAYAVLTLCRAAETLATGHQVSKRGAAELGIERFPEWSELISWARDWWYGGGSESDVTRFADTQRFVREVSAKLLVQPHTPP